MPETIFIRRISEFKNKSICFILKSPKILVINRRKKAAVMIPPESMYDCEVNNTGSYFSLIVNIFSNIVLSQNQADVMMANITGRKGDFDSPFSTSLLLFGVSKTRVHRVIRVIPKKCDLVIFSPKVK